MLDIEHISKSGELRKLIMDNSETNVHKHFPNVQNNFLKLDISRGTCNHILERNHLVDSNVPYLVLYSI